MIPARRRTRAAFSADAVAELAEALRHRDAARLRAVLHPGAALVIDDAGASAASAPLRGRVAVTAALLVLVDDPRAIDVASVNGAPGLVLRNGDHAAAVVCAQARGEKLTTVWVVTAPEKLRDWHRR